MSTLEMKWQDGASVTALSFARPALVERRDLDAAAGAARDFLQALGVACDSPGTIDSPRRSSKVAGAVTRTAALTGAMRSDPATRAEFFAAIAGKRAV